VPFLTDTVTKDKLLRMALVLFALSVIATGLIGLFVVSSLGPAAPGSTATVRVEIPPRVTSGQIARLLADKDVIRSAGAFRLYAWYKGLDGSLRAGEYDLSPGDSVPQIIVQLVAGRGTLHSFTVPEGYNTEQIADLLAAKGLADRERFLDAAAHYDFGIAFVKGLPEGERRLEGYLFPDTYSIGKDVTETVIINQMLSRFAREAELLNLDEEAAKAGLTFHQAVTLASLIEREAKIDHERAVISGVLHNRLRMSMPLQVDATVLYALGKTATEQVTYKDLEVASPYNTYRVVGLPPGPIANPGRASLEAAVHPARVPYLYYVAKADGSHAFARSLAEHNENIRKYR